MSTRTVTMPTRRGSGLTVGTHEVEATYVSASGSLAVIGDRHGWYVWHVPSGLKVPPTSPGPRGGRFSGDLMPYGYAFRLRTGARIYMEAVEAASILPTDHEASLEEIRAFKTWLETTYPKEI